jgi:dihydrofolate reductase
MRKLIVLSFISLDGVMQAPGGPEEDTSGNFKFGGWTFPYFDEFAGKMMGEQLDRSYDLLLGRKTFDIFAGYWPKQDAEHPIAKPFNAATKYVATRSPLKTDWINSKRVEGDFAEGVRTLKAGEGPELQVHGSGDMIQTLLKNDLVDEMWLKIFPVTLGNGKRLFAGGAIPAAFELTKCVAAPTGVIFANYKRNGDVRTGSF